MSTNFFTKHTVEGLCVTQEGFDDLFQRKEGREAIPFEPWDKPSVPRAFVSCKFNGIKVTGHGLSSKTFMGCKFDNVDMSGLRLYSVKFIDCGITNCNVDGTEFVDCDLIDLSMSETDFSKAKGLPILPNAGENLYKVARHILDNPADLDMDVWAPVLCGTAMCIHGHAVSLFGETAQLLTKAVGPEVAGLMLLGPEAPQHYYDEEDNAMAFLQAVVDRGCPEPQPPLVWNGPYV